jgi:DNA-binding CsgD family transcriptional regulator
MVTQTQLKQVKRLFEQDLSYNEISIKTGLTLGQIWHLVKKRLITGRYDCSKFTADELTTIRVLSAKGKNSAEIGIKMGYSSSKVKYQLLKNAN